LLLLLLIFVQSSSAAGRDVTSTGMIRSDPFLLLVLVATGIVSVQLVRCMSREELPLSLSIYLDDHHLPVR
jgi:hypothetical protein